MVQSQEFSGSFKEEDLPSNKKKIELCKKNDIQKLEALTSNVSEYDDCVQPVKEFYETFKRNYDNFKTNCDKGNGPKCCRDVNYYLDLVTGIFKATRLEDNDKNKLLKKVEEEWEPNIRLQNIYTCKRQTDLDSTRKRCILQHLYDLKEDETFILSFPKKYKDYLGEKWKKIIRYTDLQPRALFIKIENNSMGIIENYAQFLDSSDYVCGNNLDELSTDDIKFSTDVDSFVTSISLDRISPNSGTKICYNKPYVDMLKYKASNIQSINNALSIGIAFFGVFLILIFLYEFSPLGRLLHRCTKKKDKVHENISEEMIESYENSENERPYISYHSIAD
ncbi:PIR Superfamily Protein [Plasmodium ovale wallikeri]|uniref:PIR Superfamily Protein n=1 Tax=Plasmodium ovale wallikeri TaxID=864142 RepID=A0A1A9AM23_PLAOA|nr:PIR Superfamily Protein [Plasmodium ovale wallikeri]SBT58089.1 PIR Superfamily Protein [Plasmodium ovale wallikeri]